MKITWSLPAMQDRTRIFDYIEADNPRAAIAVDDRIAERISHLSLFPNSGRPGQIRGTRELVITGTPYRHLPSLKRPTLHSSHPAQRPELA